MENSQVCIYCLKTFALDELSLEHVIPQFLGGSLTSEKFKIKCVCRKCNSDLGLFVDANFEKNFLVFNNLRQCSLSLYDDTKQNGIPLSPLGECKLKVPYMTQSELCEFWLGPLGEQVFWVRPKDERLPWYSGGNPRTVKAKRSRAYFFFSERSHKKPLLTWYSFRDSFKGRKVAKIMGTIVEGEDPASIGFSPPDDIDLERIEFFYHEIQTNEFRENKVLINTKYDYRFLCKLAIGMKYCILGTSIELSNYDKELHKGLWLKPNDPNPSIRGNRTLEFENELMKMVGMKSAITINVIEHKYELILVLTINCQLIWVISMGSIDSCTFNNLKSIKDEGISIVIYKDIQKCFELSFAELVAHKIGARINNELKEIEDLVEERSTYLEQL